MLGDFRAFLIKQNVLALAIAVVIGVALGNVVTALVEHLIMPIVSAATPGGEWRDATLTVGSVVFGIGAFLAALLDFLIVGLVVWQLSKVFIKPEPRGGPTAVKACPHCTMSIGAAATRCPHCTSALVAA